MLAQKLVLSGRMLGIHGSGDTLPAQSCFRPPASEYMLFLWKINKSETESAVGADGWRAWGLRAMG